MSTFSMTKKKSITDHDDDHHQGCGQENKKFSICFVLE